MRTSIVIMTAFLLFSAYEGGRATSYPWRLSVAHDRKEVSSRDVSTERYPGIEVGERGSKFRKVLGMY